MLLASVLDVLIPIISSATKWFFIGHSNTNSARLEKTACNNNDVRRHKSN